MNGYILDKYNTLVLNGKVFVLARKKKATTNHVCKDCALNNICSHIRGDYGFLNLCMKPDLDGRWFFIDCQDLSESDRKDILCNIEDYLDIDV